MNCTVKNFNSTSKSLVNTAGKSFFQPKLKVNAPADAYEQEADHAANIIMQQPSPAPDIAPATGTNVQRKCPHCEQEGKLQRKGLASGNAAQSPATVQQSLQSGGKAMDAHTKTFMESRFGYDFSSVQIHNDSLAHQSSSDINALAYTHANHIVFGKDQYQPQTAAGKQLLAHELTHVIQQNSIGPAVQRKSYLQSENITDTRTVDKEERVKEVILKTFSNEKGVLYPYIKDKLKKFESSAVFKIDSREGFGANYKSVNKISDIKDKDVANSVQGFVDPKHQYNIYLWQQSKYCHAFHEAVHSISNLGMLLPFFGVFLNEGLTQFFTDKMFIDETGSACKNNDYGNQLIYAAKLVEFLKGDTMVKLFFNNNFSDGLDAVIKAFGLKDTAELKAFKEKRGIEAFLKAKYKISEDYNSK